MRFRLKTLDGFCSVVEVGESEIPIEETYKRPIWPTKFAPIEGSTWSERSWASRHAERRAREYRLNHNCGMFELVEVESEPIEVLNNQREIKAEALREVRDRLYRIRHYGNFHQDHHYALDVCHYEVEAMLNKVLQDMELEKVRGWA